MGLKCQGLMLLYGFILLLLVNTPKTYFAFEELPNPFRNTTIDELPQTGLTDTRMMLRLAKEQKHHPPLRFREQLFHNASNSFNISDRC